MDNLGGMHQIPWNLTADRALVTRLCPDVDFEMLFQKACLSPSPFQHGTLYLDSPNIYFTEKGGGTYLFHQLRWMRGDAYKAMYYRACVLIALNYHKTLGTCISI